MIQPADPALLVFDSSFGLMSANNEARKRLGLRPGPERDCRLDRIFLDADAAPARSAVAESFEKGRSSSRNTGVVLSGSGEPLLCEYSTHPLFRGRGEIVGVLVRFTHLEGGARTGSTVAGSGLSLLPRLDYSAVYEGLPQGVFSVDGAGRITSFNREAEKLTGLSKAQVLGRPCREVLQTSRCCNGCPLAKVLTTGTSAADDEVSLLDRSGVRRELVVSINALRAPDGGIRGAVQTLRAAAADGRAACGGQAGAPEGMIGEGPKMQALFSKVPVLAASNSAVLICGETGTGKDLLARTLHRMSPNRDGPFVAVNCSALAETLLESELFGHEKGAFTGAEKAKPGRFELAAGGTLFLDEIGELKGSLQAKLLRAIEARTFERVGGGRPIPLQARLISATNRDLKAAMGKGCFREDLFYRLRTVCLTLPPLRERVEDIPALVSHFIRRFNTRYRKDVRTLDPKVMRFLRRYPWPGNVRELEQAIEHAFVFVKGPVIFASHLPEMSDSPCPPVHGKTFDGIGAGPPDRDAVLWALARADGRRQEAAAMLGISRTSLWRRMKQLKLL